MTQQSEKSKSGAIVHPSVLNAAGGDIITRGPSASGTAAHAETLTMKIATKGRYALLISATIAYADDESMNQATE